MSETPKASDDLGEELRALGATFKEMLRAAWESDERKRAQQEIETGLDELARTLRSAGQEFAASPTGQRFKADMHDLHERLRNGQWDDPVRQELVAALRRVNEELSKAAQAWGARNDAAAGPEGGAGPSEGAS
jgi:uncharacterized membrane protein YccC